MSFPVNVGDAGPQGFTWQEECLPDDSGVLPEHGGCRCSAGLCQRGACPCACAVLSLNEETGLILALPTHEGAEMELTECGPSCACFGGCDQPGFSSGGGAGHPPVSLQQRPGKGWGVFADEPLPAGAVLCHYAGEYISNAEAQKRLAEYDAAGGGHAVLVLREWLPSGTAAVRLNIDATHRGNLARFFNHACDGGNLRLLLGRSTGSLLPRVVFITARPIAAGEELTYAYGSPNAGPQGRPCACGTAACRGFMPHEEV